MVDFRRWITALAVLALFAGLAAAQTGGSGQTQLQCGTNVSVTPTLRAEGYTEQTGDITLTCTGGSAIAPGSIIPTVNITIFLNTAVTSRLFSSSSKTSEALLLIDEPGSGISAPVPGFGPQAVQTFCATPLTGAGGGSPNCQQWATAYNPGSALTAAVTVATNTSNGTGIVTTGLGNAATTNVFQGIVNGNSVTFFGVPVLAPVTTGISRVFRFTNIRANATTLSGGSAAGATPVIASISISGATSLLISNPTPTVGFVQQGLTTSASGATSLTQCTSQTKASVSVLSFGENFGTAFKTRVSPIPLNTQNAGQGTNLTATASLQNVPGQIYNSESNFISTLGSTGNVAGLADFGTRLKATFNNVPTGVRLFVSVNNVTNGVTVPVRPTTPGDAETISFAQLVNSESASDGNAVAGFFPSVAASDNAATGLGIAEISVVNGSATAVWEVINTNPSSQESFKFSVYATYVANVAQNSPPAGTSTVNLSFAPTPPSFTASSGAAASTSLTIPRFIADPNAAKNIFSINICRSILLYPFITNQAGFDTGIAIANTSTDPFGTGPQAGSCALNWYSGPGSPAASNTGNIASGTVYTTLASVTVPGFQGYMIAVCQFQFAHGFAFISDLGARNLAMGYLAIVIPDPTTQAGGGRNASMSGCGTGDIACGGGEGDAH
jgi:hypothetical protein